MINGMEKIASAASKPNYYYVLRKQTNRSCYTKKLRLYSKKTTQITAAHVMIIVHVDELIRFVPGILLIGRVIDMNWKILI